MGSNDKTDAFFDELKSKLGSDHVDVGPYQVLHEVAHGGQGVVYKAQDRRDGTFVALKKSYESSGKIYDRLIRGVDLAATLDHKFILPILGVENESNTIWIVTPWIEGQSVSVWSRASGRTTSEIIDTYTMICSAVTHAHFRGVIHRDIRPANILIKEDGTPCVLDFGIAKRVSADEDFGRNSYSLLSGDIRYLPPELLNHESTPTDVRQDVYSLGALLYVMLTGNHPLDMASPSDSYRLVSTGEVFITRELGKLPGSIGPIIRKATSVDMNARYSAVSELVRDIQDDQKGFPIQAIAHTKKYLFLRAFHRNRVPILGALGAAILITTAIWNHLNSKQISRDLRISNQQTIGVLTGLVDSLGPTKELGPSMDSFTVLEYVSDRISEMDASNREDQIANFAGLHLSIANAYSQIHRATEGIDHAIEAYDLYSMIYSPEHIRVKESATRLAKHYIETLQPHKAEQFIGEIINHAPPSEVKYSRHVLLYAVSLIRQQKTDQAKPYLDEYLSRFTTASDERAAGLEVSAIYNGFVGKPELALRDAKELYLIWESLYGPDDARTLSSMMYWTKSLQKLGRFEETRDVVQSVLPAFVAAHGPNDDRYLSLVAQKVISDIELGYTEDALANAKSLSAQMDSHFGQEHFMSYQGRLLIARALIASRRSNDVIEMLTPEVEPFYQVTANRPRIRNLPRLYLAQAYNMLGQYDQAKSVLSPALDDVRSTMGFAHLEALPYEYENLKSNASQMPSDDLKVALTDLAGAYADAYGQDHPHTIRVRDHAERVGLEN